MLASVHPRVLLSADIYPKFGFSWLKPCSKPNELAQHTLFCDEWMKDKQPSVKPKTWVLWKSAFPNWINPKFADWPTEGISRAAVKSSAGELLSPRRIKREVYRERVFPVSSDFRKGHRPHG